VGAPVVLSVAGFGEGTIKGRVARVNASADPATRQVRVYVQVPNPGGRLVGGLFASGRVVTAEARNVLALPGAGARTDSRGGRYVWILQNGKIARRNVEVGLVDDGRDLVEIKSGLSGGETAVVGPVENLAPGQAVKVQGGGA
jgi:multidrug efflux pump subunit AcrA (membrane-fusion protein)